MRCASPVSCRNSVDGDKQWCAPCQVQAASSQELALVVPLARCPNLDMKYQARLAAHPTALVRMVLLERHDLVDAVRSALFHDTDASVVMVAVGSLQETEGLDMFKLMYRPGVNAEWLFAMAGNSNMHPRGLQFLSTHPDPAISNRATDTLLQLAARGAAPRAMSTPAR